MLIATCSNILYDKAEPRPLLVSIDQEFTRDVAGAAVEPSQLSSKLIRTVSRLDFTRDARLRSVLHHQLRVNFERVNLLTFSNAEVFWKNDTCLNFFAECCGGEDTPSRTFREYLLRLVLRRYFSLASQHHCWKMSTMSLARKVWSYDERRMVDGSATFAELWPAYESLLVDVVDMLEEWEVDV